MTRRAIGEWYIAQSGRGLAFEMNERLPNKPAAPNAAIALQFQSEHHWRGVGELGVRCRSHTPFMSCLGVHFALTEKEVAHLRSLDDEQARLEHLQEVIEEHYLNHEKQFAAESDKSWDAMHRTLADGQLSWDGGAYPLNHTVLAGELLYTDSDYIMSLKTPQQVRDIAAALPVVTEPEFRQRYFAIDAKSYSTPLSDEDVGYTWEWFQGVRDLYIRAAQEGRFVLFTADQ